MINKIAKWTNDELWSKLKMKQGEYWDDDVRSWLKFLRLDITYLIWNSLKKYLHEFNFKAKDVCFM